MKSFAHPLAILMVACVASTASAGATEDLQGGAKQLEVNMAEKKQLRALDKQEEAPASGQQLQFEIQMLTSEMNNAETASSDKTKTSIAGKIDGRTEASMAEKKQLRDLNRQEEAQELQFQIQTLTSDLQNAENVHSGK